jgi:FkbM family methyltransferase
MTAFISYAQNGEDVVLWRALRDVRNGFYVDVGAADPTVDSVTRAFYDRGWSGINIEPAGEHYECLVAERPRDINLRVVAGARAELRAFYLVPGTGLSTTEARVAERHADSGFKPIQEMLPAMPLTGILESHRGQPIHFMKIDVEGGERGVLEGLDLGVIRPWIVVIEATEPNSQVTTRDQWEDLISDRGYELALFDGLNCFYVAKEHADLKAAVALPANVWDSFRRISEQRLIEQAERDAGEMQRLKSVEHEFALLREDIPDVRELPGRISGLEKQLAATEALAAVEASRLNDELKEVRQKEAMLIAEREALLAELAETRMRRSSMAHDLALLRAELQRMRGDLSDKAFALARAEADAAAFVENLKMVSAERLRIGAEARALRLRVDLILASNSWRVTSPLRKMSLLAKRMLRSTGPHPEGAESSSLSSGPAPAAQASEASRPRVRPPEGSGSSAAIPRRAQLILARLDQLTRP